MLSPLVSSRIASENRRWNKPVHWTILQPTNGGVSHPKNQFWTSSSTVHIFCIKCQPIDVSSAVEPQSTTSQSMGKQHPWGPAALPKGEGWGSHEMFLLQIVSHFYEPPLLGDLSAGALPHRWEPTAVPPAPAASNWSQPSLGEAALLFWCGQLASRLTWPGTWPCWMGPWWTKMVLGIFNPICNSTLICNKSC